MLDFSKISYVGQSTGSSRSKSSEPNWPVVQLQTTGFKQARSLWFSKLALKELGVDLEAEAKKSAESKGETKAPGSLEGAL